MRDKKHLFIKCPRCGREYHAAEIYIPNAFFGKPSIIERDATTGRIDNFYGDDMDLVEHYICDKCNTPFKVTAKLQFNVVEEDKINFNKDYKTKFRTQGIFLSEE